MDDTPPDPPGRDEPEPPFSPPEFVIVEPGFVPPDPAEPPPVELWRVVGDVPPWGTVLLLLAWAVVFAGFALRHEIGDGAAYIAHGASLSQRDAADASWRLLASTFLHSGYRHLFFNSLAMLVFGPAVERIFTRWGFWIVFAWGGAAASLTSLLWRLARDGAAYHISIGASGAIFALAGALLTGAWRLRRRLAVGRARALAAAILFFSAPAIVQGFHEIGTDNAAHVGGVVAGLVLGAIVPISPRLGDRPPGLLTGLAGALGALALAASFVRALITG
ncbi:MAG: rhomboid family intramembrane serine protease [Candidatus Eisenbacteria bacterium]